MNATGNDSAAMVEFTGKVQRIARVHQFGLKDKTAVNRPAVYYPKRVLLGFNNDDRRLIEEAVVRHLIE